MWEKRKMRYSLSLCFLPRNKRFADFRHLPPLKKPYRYYLKKNTIKPCWILIKNLMMLGHFRVILLGLCEQVFYMPFLDFRFQIKRNGLMKADRKEVHMPQWLLTLSMRRIWTWWPVLPFTTICSVSLIVLELRPVNPFCPDKIPVMIQLLFATRQRTKATRFWISVWCNKTILPAIIGDNY